MKTFYQAVIAAMEHPENKSKFTDQEITPIKYIDLYADQYLNPEAFDLFAQNALLVDWDIDYSDDTPIATINFHCCYEQLRFTDNLSANRELGLKFLDYVVVIDKILQNIQSPETGRLELYNEGFLKMDSIVDVYILSYRCSYNGRKQKPKYQDGDYENLDLKGNLVKKITRPIIEPGIDYGLE